MFQECKTEEDVKILFRQIAMYLHPDKGGEPKLMQLLVDAKACALEAVLGYEEFVQRFDTKQRSYTLAVEYVLYGDERLELLNDISEYAEKHPSFRTDYLESVVEYLNRKGYVTDAQYNSLVKCFYAFRMDKDE